MSRPGASESIEHHEGRSGKSGAFDLLVAGERLGHLNYSLPDNETMTIDYVEVDPSLRGRGMGQQLVGAAVDWARVQSRKVVPLCSYARAVMARTAGFQDVLAKR
jgi:predicted GNAT family acetyltransferase